MSQSSLVTAITEAPSAKANEARDKADLEQMNVIYRSLFLDYCAVRDMLLPKLDRKVGELTGADLYSVDGLHWYAEPNHAIDMAIPVWRERIGK